MGADNIGPLVDEIRGRTLKGGVEAGTVALLNLIPFAGGAVASVVGAFASQRRFEIVCDVLTFLNAAISKAGVLPQQYLSVDQIIELVHETLHTATVTSDERKRVALKTFLANAFVSPGLFDSKQLFLAVLRDMTSIELAVLPVLYQVADPYVIGHCPILRREESTEPQPPADGYVHLRPGYWHAGGHSEGTGRVLLDYLAETSGVAAGLLEGVLRLLDAKGLSSASPNLQRRDYLIVSWLPVPEEKLLLLRKAIIGFDHSSRLSPSPLAASRTTFGSLFLQSWTGVNSSQVLTAAEGTRER